MKNMFALSLAGVLFGAVLTLAVGCHGSAAKNNDRKLGWD